jgi:single-strand DNA-binding protein
VSGPRSRWPANPPNRKGTTTDHVHRHHGDHRRQPHRRPRTRVLATGTGYARFSIAATPRRYNRDTDQWVDGETLFLRCVAWRELADHAAESLRKGTRVLASGVLRQSTWETPEGEKRSAIDLHVDEIGPSLRFATATVTKATRDDGRPAPTDPWASAPQPATASARAGVPGFTDQTGSDQPPF